MTDRAQQATAIARQLVARYPAADRPPACALRGVGRLALDLSASCDLMLAGEGHLRDHLGMTFVRLR